MNGLRSLERRLNNAKALTSAVEEKRRREAVREVYGRMSDEQLRYLAQQRGDVTDDGIREVFAAVDGLWVLGIKSLNN